MFSKRAFAANASFLSQRSTLQRILTILRMLGSGGPRRGPEEEIPDSYVPRAQAPRELSFSKVTKREKERKKEISQPCIYELHSRALLKSFSEEILQ